MQEVTAVSASGISAMVLITSKLVLEWTASRPKIPAVMPASMRAYTD